MHVLDNVATMRSATSSHERFTATTLGITVGTVTAHVVSVLCKTAKRSALSRGGVLSLVPPLNGRMTCISRASEWSQRHCSMFWTGECKDGAMVSKLPVVGIAVAIQTGLDGSKHA